MSTMRYVTRFSFCPCALLQKPTQASTIGVSWLRSIQKVYARKCQIKSMSNIRHRQDLQHHPRSISIDGFLPSRNPHASLHFFFSRIKILSILMNETNASFPNSSGRRSLHIQKHTCASCGYPAAKTRGCTFFRLLSISVLRYIPLSLNALTPKPPNINSSVG